MNIELKSKIQNDKYTNYVYDTFDIQNREETSVSIPMNLDGLNSFDWNIGVIYGGSGCGKSTILNTLGGVKEIEFDKDKALISNFDWLEPEQASRVLTSIGLSSVYLFYEPSLRHLVLGIIIIIIITIIIIVIIMIHHHHHHHHHHH